MTLREFTSQNQRTIVRLNHSFDFTKLPDEQWLISVYLMGIEKTDVLKGLHKWEVATTIVTDVQAAAIYTNLLNSEGE